jgi:hypothetical protein
MGCELSIINPDKLVINYLCLQCCADQRQELFASYDVDRKMDGLDDQTTCGHELDANNHRNYPESNETSERDGGQAGNDVKLTGSAPAVYTHGVASGNSFHDHDSRENRLSRQDMEEVEAQGASHRQEQARTSLEDLQGWNHSQKLPGPDLSGAIEIPLPPSDASSLKNTDSLEIQQLSQARSLEELMLRPDHVALQQEACEAEPLSDRTPGKQEFQVYDRSSLANGSQGRNSPEQQPLARSNLWDKVLAALGSTGRIQQARKQRTAQAPSDLVGTEAEIYRMNLTKWATHFPNLDNVNAGFTRHAWSSRIVYFDTMELQQFGAALPREPWPGLLFPPTYEDFHRTLRRVPNNCRQRLIFVEDLNPSLIDFLGAAFHIPPHVFEEHLDGSGYTTRHEQRDSPTRWQNHFFAQGSSSITWFRPVVPLLPINPLLREQILGDQSPEVRCIFDDCKRQHTQKVRTTANIWRRNMALCPYPGAFLKNSETQYPVAWEERVTIWTREFGDCKYGKQSRLRNKMNTILRTNQSVILLLDPLPFITGEEGTGITKKKASKPIMVVAPVKEPQSSARGARNHQSSQVTQHRQTQRWVAQQRSSRSPPPYPALNFASPLSAPSHATDAPVPSPRLLDVPSGKQCVLNNANKMTNKEALLLIVMKLDEPHMNAYQLHLPRAPQSKVVRCILPCYAANLQHCNSRHFTNATLDNASPHASGLQLPSPSVQPGTSRSQTLGAKFEFTRVDKPTTNVRRRGARLGLKRVSKTHIQHDTTTIDKARREPSVGEHSAAVPQVPNRPQPEISPQSHGPLVPYHPIKAKSSSSAKLGEAFAAHDIASYVKDLQVPVSMLQEFEYSLLSTTKGKELVHDPLRVLFRFIHDDTQSVTDIVRDSLQRIRRDTLDEDVMQQRVTFWRQLFHQLNSSLAEVDQQLRAFTHFTQGLAAPYPGSSQHVELPSEKLAGDTRQTLRSCIDLLEKSSMALLTEMQIVDSRRSIAEAESISKLTELAFVFIPLSFVASLFSMEVRELNGGVPVYAFILAAIATVFVAYAMRLGIRSSRLIEYKSRMLLQVRTRSQIPYNQPLPTHIFLAWAFVNTSSSLSKWSAKIFEVVAPFLLMAALVAALFSPIVLLWLRGISKGFTIVITVLMLLLDMVLVLPLVRHGHRALGSSPIDVVRDLRRRYRESQKRKARAKAEQLNISSLSNLTMDPEAQEAASSRASAEHNNIRTSVSTR